MLGLSAGAVNAAVRLAGLTQPVGGVLRPAWGSLLHQRLGRLGSYLVLPRLGVLLERFLSVWAQRGRKWEH